MLKGLASGLAGAVALPAVAGGAPGASQHTTHQPATQAPVGADAPAAPQSLDAHELRTLAAIGDRLVPGSAAAGVAGLIDRLLAVEPLDIQQRLRSALGVFEREARARHARPWVDLSAMEQTAILDEAATAAPGATEPPAWRPGLPVVPVPPSAPLPAPPVTLRDHLTFLRDTVSRTYFGTEAGMRELGWTGNVFFEGLPQCEHEGH